MSKIKLVETGFSLIPEGVTTFKVVQVVYKEDFGKMEVTLQTKSGQKHTERFTLINSKGEVNEGAMKAFSFFAKTCLNNFNLDEIDDQDIVGCYIKAEVTHVEYESNKEKGKMLKSASLINYEVAVGFGTDTSVNIDNDIDLDTLDELDDLI